MATPVRFGVIGPGRIFDNVMRCMGMVNDARFTAVASRDLARARAAAAKHGIARAFGGYAELAACKDVDAVYIATPHNFHCEQAILCMEHGKHVLVEKPMALNDLEVSRMIQCASANHVFLMEAMWTRFLPANARVLKLAHSGELGKLLHMSVDACFRAPNDPGSRLWSPNLAGGALLDVGVYALLYTSMILGYRPLSVRSSAVIGNTGVDEAAMIQLIYPDGKTAQLSCALRVNLPFTARLYFEEAMLEVPNFMGAQELVITRGGETVREAFETRTPGFCYEFEHMCECIQNGIMISPILPLEESLAIAKLSTDMRREWGLAYPGETL